MNTLTEEVQSTNTVSSQVICFWENKILRQSTRIHKPPTVISFGSLDKEYVKSEEGFGRSKT